jgi:hypothetical protein
MPAIPDKDEVVGSNPIGPTYENASISATNAANRGVFRFPPCLTKSDDNRQTSTVPGVVTGVRTLPPAPYPRLSPASHDNRDLSAVPISLPPLRHVPLAPIAALACLVVLAVAVVALVLAGVAGRVTKGVAK